MFFVGRRRDGHLLPAGREHGRHQGQGQKRQRDQRLLHAAHRRPLRRRGRPRPRPRRRRPQAPRPRRGGDVDAAARRGGPARGLRGAKSRALTSKVDGDGYAPQAPSPSPKRVHSTASPSRRRFISEQVGGERTFVAPPSAASLAQAVDSAPSPAPQADAVVRVSRAATPPHHQTAGDTSPATRPPSRKQPTPTDVFGHRPRRYHRRHKPRSTPTSSLVIPSPPRRHANDPDGPSPGAPLPPPSWPLECSKRHSSTPFTNAGNSTRASLGPAAPERLSTAPGRWPRCRGHDGFPEPPPCGARWARRRRGLRKTPPPTRAARSRRDALERRERGQVRGVRERRPHEPPVPRADDVDGLEEDDDVGALDGRDERGRERAEQRAAVPLACVQIKSSTRLQCEHIRMC